MSKPQNEILDEVFATALNDAAGRKEVALQLRDVCQALGPERFKREIERQVSSMDALDALAITKGISESLEILKQNQSS